MKSKVLSALFVATGILTTSAVYADHNSVWGEGWANMPNDVHNTRIDTLGDNDEFVDFVQYGDGADTVNRFTDDVEFEREFERDMEDRMERDIDMADIRSDSSVGRGR